MVYWHYVRLRPHHLDKIETDSRIGQSWIFTFACRPKGIKFVPAPLLVGVELNPGPPAGDHLSEPERWRIVFLRDENGLNPTEIARKMKCSRHTVYNILKKFDQTGTVHDLPGKGRKSKLTQVEEKKLV